MMDLGRLKKALFGIQPPIPEAVSEFVGLERIYRTPPLTEEYVAAIHLIAPNCRDYRPTEKYRGFWEQYQNAACWSEFQALKPVFDAFPKPRKVLEIGPGLGRSLVFFTKKLGWHDAEIHAFEGDGTTTKYTKLGPRFEDSFCGNISMLQETLEYNDVRNVTVHNAKVMPLRLLPGHFDLVYSFYSIGFHWSVEHFLGDILPLLGDDGMAIFTVPPSFVAPSQLAGLHYEVVPLFPNARKASRRDSLLLLRKSPFPPKVATVEA